MLGVAGGFAVSVGLDKFNVIGELFGEGGFSFGGPVFVGSAVVFHDGGFVVVGEDLAVEDKRNVGDVNAVVPLLIVEEVVAEKRKERLVGFGIIAAVVGDVVVVDFVDMVGFCDIV